MNGRRPNASPTSSVPSTAWQARRHPSATRQEIERQTLDYMATMPAWQDHPRVAASRPSQAP